jgi:hypothetical protein
MTAWTAAELDAFETAHELRIASRRADGSLRPFVTIWMARVGDELFVRPAHGPETGWHRRAVAAGAGRIEAGAGARDAVFEATDLDQADAIDAAYHAKYDAHYPKQYVDPVVSDVSRGLTLRVVPA